jgi:hypothetical protein
MEEGHEICQGCGCEIDPKICWCGGVIEAHGIGDGHAPVPMGCNCHREPPTTREEREDAARKIHGSKRFGRRTLGD